MDAALQRWKVDAMGVLRFGKQETVTCIVDVDARGGGGEPACLAFKTSIYWAGGGVYLSDDGYVLKPRGSGNTYYELSNAARDGQVEGLPSPLPPYSIPFMEYFGGYSLWWAIGAVIVWGVGVKKVRRHKQVAFAAKQSATPIDRGPPRLDTNGDRFVYETIKATLAPGESIQHQAYACSWDYTNEKAGDAVFFLVLTTDRLCVIKSRKGAFGILYENEGVDVIDRRTIAAAAVDHGNVLFITTADGIQRGYVVKATGALSNQQSFLMNVGRILSRA